MRSRWSSPTSPNAVKRETQQSEIHFSRGARLGFLFLLFLTVLFASGALFLTYQLGNYRDELNQRLEARLGANLVFETVSLNGIRGLNIKSLKVELPFEHGPAITMTVPEAKLWINLKSLLQGQLALDRLTLDDAVIDVVRPMGSVWYPDEPLSLDLDSDWASSEEVSPFRIEGTGGVIRARNIVHDSSVELNEIDFSIVRQAGSGGFAAQVQGNLSNEFRKPFMIKANFESLDDFHVRIEQSSLTPEDAQIFFPSESPLVLSGEISPSIQIYGGPNNVVILNLQTTFRNAQIQDQPEFIKPATGTLKVFASYDTSVRELDIMAAKIESEEITGAIDGSVYFTENGQLFDLQLLCTQIPIGSMIDSILDRQLDKYGTVEYELEPQQQLTITLQGTSESPVFRSIVNSSGGRLNYTPADEQYPPVSLTLGSITGTWDSVTEVAEGSIDILDGTVEHKQSKLTATDIKGTLRLADNKLTLGPVNATITENPFVGSFEYDMDTEDATITLNGTVQNLEDTAYHDSIRHMKLAGALNVKLVARRDGGEYYLDAQVEASQSEIDYMWWFKKPPGVGATGFIHGRITPKESYHFEFDADLASSQLFAFIDGEYFDADSNFRLMTAGVTSNYLDITTVGSCITLPYRLTGTSGGYGYLEYERHPDIFDYSTQKMGVFINEADLLPLNENAKESIHFENASIFAMIKNDDINSGVIELTSESLDTPPFSSTWFVALEPPPEYPPRDRDWVYTVASDAMTLPPWRGTSFKGEAYSSPTMVGFHSFSANIDDGTLDGTYHAVREENSYETSIIWENVPAHYFLEHLNYDDILTGTASGEVQYGVDKDDPGTLKGTGKFDIRDGQFNADFLYALVSGEDGQGLAALPPKLEFTSFHSSVGLDSDKVNTPDLVLESEGLYLEGDGEYIRDGDMNYTIKVRVSPEMAESIPSMRDSLNLKGFELSGQKIELVFNVVGPTFGPRGELAGLPPSRVQLVSGAGQLFREGINVIDTPRRILRDLLKTIGAVIGAGATK